jgi:uncharacterized membrane protein YccC
MKKYFSFSIHSVSFALRIMLGCSIAWWSLHAVHDKSKVWALISVIIVSDPDFNIVRNNAIARFINTTTGCLLGLICLFLIGVNVWSLMTGIILAAIFSTSFKNYPANWKLAPTTVVIIIAPAIFENEKVDAALIFALTRTAEVLYGSLIALGLGFVYHKFKDWKERPKSGK